MKKELFLNFVQDNILSLFTGSEIAGEEESSSRDACVAQGSAGTILVKFKHSDNYRLIIKRVQPFKVFEVSLVRSIIEEIKKVYNPDVPFEFIKNIENFVVEKAICRALTEHYTTLQTLISEISDWANRTYEGRKTQFGFILCSKRSGKSSNPNLHINKIMKSDFSALLSDGENTGLEISSDGYLLNYITLPKVYDQNLLVPYHQLRFASICKGKRIGICLLTEGDILLFKDQSLLFAKRNGKWISFSHDEIIGKLAERSGEVEEVRRSIYLSAIDTSFARNGGCIVHVNNTDKYNVLKHLNIADVLYKDCYDYMKQESINHSFFYELKEEPESVESFEQFIREPECIKTANLIKIIGGQKFQDLDRKLRQELLAIDGATIIDYEGNIIAAGAIIKIEAGSSGGGRLAAAKTLSNYGISIKVSADGSVSGFRMDRQKLRVRPLFVIG